MVSPVTAIERFLQLMTELTFWKAVLFSAERIVGGFFLGVLGGSLAAVLAYRYEKLEELFYPLICVMKATPVASFIILVLMWVSSDNLSVCIVVIMSFPIMYINTLEGLKQLKEELHEMAEVFQIPKWVRVRWMYTPQILPYVRAGCALGIGMSWKAGVAAEVIGIASGSMGEKLYQAKIYLETADLFAWTMAIISLSYLFEKILVKTLDAAVKRLSRMSKTAAGKERTCEAFHTIQQDVVLTHVQKSYDDHAVIKDLSMIIPGGDLTCIMAPSGSGKTTLLRILMGLETADEGRIEGLENQKKSAVFQDQIFCEELSVYANIRLVTKQKLFEAEQPEYEKIKNELKEIGLEQCIDQKIKELSYGMRQRVALVRALYAKWDILFLDEPFRGLDQETKKAAIEYTKRKCAGKSVVFVTHDEKEKIEMRL